jgi:hypothetical protein
MKYKHQKRQSPQDRQSPEKTIIYLNFVCLKGADFKLKLK